MTTRDHFAADYDVPRGTMAKFDTYAAMLEEWQGRMNLVGPATLPLIWSRHFADSAQLLKLGQPGTWLDIGAGAGFPGVVLALLGADRVRLVESTTKKCSFLQAVVDALELANVEIHNVRVEDLPASGVDNITARACANLTQLFTWGERFATRGTRWMLLKGATVEAEIADARRSFSFTSELVQSDTDERGRIVVARSVRRSGAR